jgi:hypothetical protein
VVAQRFGFDEDEALTSGKVVAGLNAQANGRRLGIFKPHEKKAKKTREKEQGERDMMRLAKSYKPKEVADQAFFLYERFRPAIPEGVSTRSEVTGLKGPAHGDLRQVLWPAGERQIRANAQGRHREGG